MTYGKCGVFAGFRQILTAGGRTSQEYGPGAVALAIWRKNAQDGAGSAGRGADAADDGPGQADAQLRAVPDTGLHADRRAEAAGRDEELQVSLSPEMVTMVVMAGGWRGICAKCLL